MYTYFAAGNLDAIAPQLCPGLLGSLHSRIAQRPPGTFVKWRLHKHITPPRLVSLRNSFIPGGEQTNHTRNGVMQAIVRIHTLQSAQSVKTVYRKEQGVTLAYDVRVDAQGKEIERERRPDDTNPRKLSNGDEIVNTRPEDVRPPKETVEYFVLQSVLRRSEMAPWMIWGTADEMTVERYEKLYKKEEKKK